MKLNPILHVAGLLALLSTASAASKFDVIVVGQRFAPPAGQEKTAYALVDGGYLEAGDAMAGEQPPTREAVSAALQHAMIAQHFAMAKGATQPAELVICHWGVIREDSTTVSPPNDIPPNYRERLSLVATPDVVNRLVERTTTLMSGSARDMTTAEEQTALELAREPRYFVVLSAYDMPALMNRQVRLLWRTRISVADKDTAMFEAVPTMLTVASKFIGETTKVPEVIRASLPEQDHNHPAPTRPTSDIAMSKNVATLLPPAVIRELVLRERDLAGGKKSPRELGI